MNKFLNFIFNMIIMVSLGVTCLFLLILSDYKDELWKCIKFKKKGDKNGTD